MKIEEFDYHLPKSLIAQYPSSERGASRLMVVHRHRDGKLDDPFAEVERELIADTSGLRLKYGGVHER